MIFLLNMQLFKKLEILIYDKATKVLLDIQIWKDLIMVILDNIYHPLLI